MPEIRTMDVWLPDAPSRNGAALLFIHGGGWKAGNKQQFADVAAWFCRHGFVCASMKYRLSGEAKYPAAVEDARLAMSFLRGQADRWGFKPDKLASIGSSAGGYLAAMLGLTATEKGGIEEGPLIRLSRPNAIALYCPVTTLSADRAFVREFMGVHVQDAPELYVEASPIHRVRGTEPPILVVQGDADTTTPIEEARLFVQRLQEAGGSAELVTLPGVGHGFGYGVKTDAQQTSCEHMLGFLRRTLAVS
jgi:acetyl esterase/lipase